MRCLKNTGMSVLRQMGLRNMKVLQPSLSEGNFYLYLHKKHKDLIPKITAELKKMQQDGTIKRINAAVLNKYTEQ